MDSTTGVCSPNNDVHVTQMLSEMDSEIIDGENSGEDRTRNV